MGRRARRPSLAKVVVGVGAPTLLPKIARKVLPESVVYTDEYTPYRDLEKMG